MTCNLYRITRNTPCDYDQYEGAVVVAEDEAQARMIHPSGEGQDWCVECYDETLDETSDQWRRRLEFDEDADWDTKTWVRPEDVRVEHIGVADGRFSPGDVVVASFHAG